MRHTSYLIYSLEWQARGNEVIHKSRVRVRRDSDLASHTGITNKPISTQTYGKESAQ
jgi:hypothetical protein